MGLISGINVWHECKAGIETPPRALPLPDMLSREKCKTSGQEKYECGQRDRAGEERRTAENCRWMRDGHWRLVGGATEQFICHCQIGSLFAHN